MYIYVNIKGLGYFLNKVYDFEDLIKCVSFLVFFVNSVILKCNVYFFKFIIV